MRRLKPLAAIAAFIMTQIVTPHITYRYQGLCSSTFAEESSWQQEFKDICSKTDEAMSFSKDELKMLLQRGEKLRPIIESLEETPRKIYLKRLQMCMNLYRFVLESKGTDQKQ